MTEQLKKQLLIVLGSGGHTTEMLSLVDLLGPDFEYVYLMEREDVFSQARIRIPGPVFQVHQPNRFGDPLWLAAIKTVRSALEACILLARVRPDAIVACGRGLAFPVCFLGCLIGAKVIFIETAARVRSRSLTGRLVHPFADLFYVQWEEAKALYPGSRYAGRFL